ncbi:unnamed protein product [Closterium sp. NIES-53]
MYGSNSRPFTVEELFDRLRRAAGDRSGAAVDKGARQLQLTGLGDGWAVDQEGLFDREVDLRSEQRSTRGARRQQLTLLVDRVTCYASSAEARKRRQGVDNSRRMHNGASRANRLRPPASVRTAVFYGATLDIHSVAALAHRRPAALACRLFAVLARLLYATLAGGRPCYAVGRPG